MPPTATMAPELEIRRHPDFPFCPVLPLPLPPPGPLRTAAPAVGPELGYGVGARAAVSSAWDSLLPVATWWAPCHRGLGLKVTHSGRPLSVHLSGGHPDITVPPTLHSLHSPNHHLLFSLIGFRISSLSPRPPPRPIMLFHLLRDLVCVAQSCIPRT